MIQKFLDKLEFNIIVNKIADNCLTYSGKNIANNLIPSDDELDILKNLNETSEAVNLVESFGSFPIYEITDQAISLKKIKSNIPLSTKSLLEIANILKISEELKKYYSDSEMQLSNLSSYFQELYTNPKIKI